MIKEANSQTKATAKWQAKAGYVSKAYKLKKQLVDDFKIACEKKGVSQARQLSIMMEEFIESQKDNS